MQTKETLQEIKANGYNIDFGNTFNNAFENYKRIALSGGVAILLLFILFFTLAFFIGLSAAGIALTTDSVSQFDVANLSPMWLMGYIFALVVMTVLISPFNAGMLKMAQAAYQGESFSVGTAFDYYRSGYFKEIVLATLVLAFFSSIFSVGLQWIGYQILGMLMSFAISILTFLTIPLIIFGNLKAMEAIEGSILIVSKQFLILFALLICSTIFVGCGLLLLCIGIVFTMPFLYAMHYSIYREIMGDGTPDVVSDTTSME